MAARQFAERRRCKSNLYFILFLPRRACALLISQLCWRRVLHCCCCGSSGTPGQLLAFRVVTGGKRPDKCSWAPYRHRLKHFHTFLSRVQMENPVFWLLRHYSVSNAKNPCLQHCFGCMVWNHMGSYSFLWASDWFRSCVKIIVIVHHVGNSAQLSISSTHTKFPNRGRTNAFSTCTNEHYTANVRSVKLSSVNAQLWYQSCPRVIKTPGKIFTGTIKI